MNVSQREFDLVIIGGGPGGYVAALRAAQLGLTTCLIEKEKVGGTCLHKGCIPTKSLLHSAYLYQICKRSYDFGIKMTQAEIDILQIQKRKMEVVDKLYKGVKFLLKKGKIEVATAEGRLMRNNKVVLWQENQDIGEIKGRNIIIATGSNPLIPSWIPYDGNYVMTSDEILKMESIPERLIIIGGGAVGVEFAFIFNTFGSEVTIVEMKDVILPEGEKDISEILQKSLRRQGIKIHTGTSVKRVSPVNGKVEVEIAKGETQKEILFSSKVLLAMGRRPDLSSIGSEGIGIEMEGPFIKVGDRCGTTASGIFAIGDIAGPPLLAHKASQQGIISVETIAGRKPVPIDLKSIPSVTYSIPQVASIGMTSREALHKGYKITEGRFPFSANSKALIEGEENIGMIKIIAEEKYGEILGVHMIGPHVSELIGGFSLALSLNATYMDITGSIFPHPTLSEVIKEAAHALGGGAIHI